MNKMTVIDPALEFDEIPLETALEERDRWAELAANALEPNPFFEPEFLKPFAEHVAGVPVTIAVLRDPATDAWAGLVPIVHRRLGLGFSGKPASFFGHDYGPLATPLLDKKRADRAASDLLYRLLSVERTMICAPHTRLTGPVFRCLEGAVIDNGFSLTVTGNYQRAMQNAQCSEGGYIERVLSKSRRRQFAKQLRRLSAKGDVQLESHSDPERTSETFQDFLELEAAGWKGRGRSALMNRPHALCFAKEMAAGFIEQGRMRADVLTLDGQPIGIVINLRAGREVFPWKMAFDENHREVSPGMQTLIRTTEENCQDVGIDQADSLTGPDSPTVDALWGEQCDMGTLILSVGSMGTLQGRILDFDKTGHDILRRKAKSLLKRFR